MTSLELPPPSTELFCIGMLAEITFSCASRVSRGEDPPAAYLAAMRDVVARYRLDGAADTLPEPERLMLQQLQPILAWWDKLAVGLSAAGLPR